MVRWPAIWWRYWFVGTALVLLGLSFEPWFHQDVSGIARFDRVNAWQGSSLWTYAVLLAVLACAVGALATRATRAVAPSAAMWVVAIAASGSVALWIRQWWLINHAAPYHGRLEAVFVVGSEQPSNLHHGIKRDQLADYASLGIHVHARITTWSYAAGALIAGLALSAVLRMIAERRRPAAPETD